MKAHTLSRFSIIAFLTTLSMYVHAQNNAIKVNFLSPVMRTANVSFERKLSPSTSSQIGIFYTTVSLGSTSYKGYGITPEFRFYLSDEKEAIAGFYLAPFLRYQTFELSDSGSKADFTSFGGGLVVGHQWVFKKRITLDLFIGPKYMSHDIKVTSGSTVDFDTKGFSGFGVRSGATIGVAF